MDNEVFMHDFDHYGNVIDGSKEGGIMPFLLNKNSYFFLNDSSRMQTSTEIMSQMDSPWPQ